MANQFDANIPQGREKIAFKRVRNGQASSLNSGTFNNNGVLVIDPNMVFDQSNKLVDRYVKQEDMVMYCSLKVYKKSELVVTDKDGVRTNDYNSSPIEINLLNPLKSVNNQTFNFKNVFTSQWTDFFTSNAANNVNDQESYILDPETFGIASIDYAVNANHVPMITMRFIDIQGRMLFERGNDPNNPYNIFFTLPYPKFLLTFKGYYGKAVEVQLVFMRANTRFDPSTGNYEVTVEFQGDVFSLLQSFVTIYPYVAPYMFLMDDGMYLGQKILNSIYDQQNLAITNELGTNQTELDKYIITSYPTLWDLANALTKIPFNTLGNSGQLNPSAANNDIILSIKTSFENLNDGINNFFGDKTKYTPSTTTKTNAVNNYTVFDIYSPISPNYNLSNVNLSEFAQGLKTFNDNVKQIQTISTSQNNFINGIKKRINADPTLKDVITNFDPNNALTNSMFYFDGKTDTYTLVYFNLLVNIVIDEVSKVEAVIEDAYVDDAISDIGKVLGYQPNLGNILRIIANNMQTFLILMEIISINSAKQLQSDSNRVRKHVLNTTYKSNIANTVKYYSPFPYYYKTISDGTSTKKVMVYPGIDTANQNWFEVAFVEEIYTSLTVLKHKVNPGKNTALFGTKKTGLSTIFSLGEVDMTAYENKRQANDILAELLTKYSLHASFSGMYYRGMTPDNLTNHYSANMAQFEMDLINELVFANLSGGGSQYLLTNSLKNAIDINGTNTNLGTFARNYLKLGNATNTYKSIIAQSVAEINKYKIPYVQADVDKIVSTRAALVTNNISNRTLYSQLYNTNLLPTTFSMSQSKKAQELSVYADLFSNVFYYCDINTGNSLNDINTGLQGVDSTKYNTNSFQGFIWQLNKKLMDPTLPIKTDFTSNISYGKNTVPSLTFNNLVSDNPTVFKVITKPAVNIIQKYKKVIQS